MNEQTIPSSYSKSTRELVDNPYLFNIDGNYIAEIYNKINMQNYAKRMIPDYVNITKIPDGHLPKDLDPYGYEDNWYNAFRGCRNLTSLPDPFYNWNGATNISHIFYYCDSLNCSISNIPDSVTNMYSAFESCSNLTGSIPNIPNSVTNMASAFDSCSNLTGNIPNIPNSVTNMANAFESCSNLIGNIPNIPDSVTNMTYAFYYCNNLTGPIGKIGNNVKNMRNSFWSCSNLTGNIPTIPNGVADIKGAFAYCNNLSGTIPEIPESVINIDCAFWCCENLTGSIPKIPNNTVYSAYSFANCFNVTTLDFDTLPNTITDAYAMFHGCRSITSNIPNYSGIKSEGMQEMFSGCCNMRGTLHPFPNTVTNFHGAFFECRNITGSIPELPENTEELDNFVTNCVNLTGKFPNIPSKAKSCVQTFRNCVNMSASDVYVFSDEIGYCSNMFMGCINRINIYVHPNTNTYNSFKKYFDSNNHNASWNAYLYTF